ncbi:MAG: helix-turn-helix domain-containing protein, partial [bacterium]|nr:helix-turn-helix domain-containing protein [bacterium]
VTKEVVLKILGKTASDVKEFKKAILPQDVVSAVSNYYSVGKRALLGESRARPIAGPRQILMYLLRVELRLPLQEVGRLVGGRDHTTVMHAVGKITASLSTNNNLRSDLLGIKQQVSG